MSRQPRRPATSRARRLLRSADESHPTREHHRVYVVRLDHPRARGREAFYVGMTGLPIEERFANHKRGYKCSRVVERYGVELAYEFFDEIPPMSYAEAVLAEPTLADDLRDLGHLVFGPTNRTPRTRPRTSKNRKHNR